MQGLSFKNQNPGGASNLGNMSATLSHLPNLRVLNISNSRLGDDLAALSSLTHLVTLDISRTYSWSGPQRSVPTSWCGLTSLKELIASEAGLSGALDSLPLSAGCLQNLQVLRLGGNRGVIGTLPAGTSHTSLKQVAQESSYARVHAWRVPDCPVHYTASLLRKQHQHSKWCCWHTQSGGVGALSDTAHSVKVRAPAVAVSHTSATTLLCVSAAQPGQRCS